MTIDKKEFKPLQESCEKLSNFVEETQEKQKIDPRNKSRLKNIQKELVYEAATLINKKVNEKLIDIRKRVDPLLQEMEELIERINKRF